jgi:RNA polymerase sigma-70 factor (ECF subfamily)
MEKLNGAEPRAAFSQVDGPDSVLISALQRLSATDQEVLALAAWEELRPREAAIVLGVSPAWYRVRLHRAKRRLLRELEESASSAGHPLPVPLTREGVAK